MKNWKTSWTKAFALLVAASLFSSCNRVAPPAETGAQASAEGPHYEGGVDKIDCDKIAGWVWDSRNPDVAVSVLIHDGPSVAGSVEANAFRPDLKAAGKGSGQHGFEIPTPPRVKDGQPHSISVKIKDNGVEIANSPRNLTCPPVAPSQ